MNKDVVIGSKAREKMKDGVDILANAVKATLGPRGRHAAIERKSGPPIITKDGVTVAKYINLKDRAQNMGAQLIKSVASDANNDAGDGTTTATVLAQEIYSRGYKQTVAGVNPVLLKRGIDLAVQIVVQRLKELSISISDEKTICHVATISANNDVFLGKMISEAVSAVGNDGIISIEEAAGNVTEVQYGEGITLERGWLNENFVTNPSRNTCEMDDPYILTYDGDIKTIHVLVNILNKVIETGRPLLIIARNIEVEALAHVVLNVVNNTIRCCVIKAPGFGDSRRAILEDVFVQTGARVFSDVGGVKMEDATLQHLGQARRVIVGLNSTKIIDGATPPEAIETALERLKTQIQDENIFDHQRKILKERISRLSGGAAIFKVGATSEGEMREKKDRVEDAINAVRSALSEGIVPGGGSALLHCISSLDSLREKQSLLLKEERVGIEVVRAALQSPFNQILLNAGVENRAELIEKIITTGSFSGYDALNLEFVENMLDKGIVDPTRVVRSALEHAASASGILLTTEVLICELEDDLDS